MSSQSSEGVQPIKTFRGADKVLELYPNYLCVRREDTLAKILPSMFDDVQTIDLVDIAGVYLHESKYTYSRWLTLVLQLTNHKHITILYSRKNHAEAQEIKRLLDDLIQQRQFQAVAHA